MNRQAFTKFSLSVLAAVTASALVLMVAPSPSIAVSIDSIENQSFVRKAEAVGFTPAPPQVPALESAVGRGAALTTVPITQADSTRGRVALGDAASGSTAALVRVTLLAPTAETSVFTTQAGSSASGASTPLDDLSGTQLTQSLDAVPGPTPILYAAAGKTVSTTVLLPIVNGAVPLYADRDEAPVRVEALAFFAGGANAPGATVALAAPELRADTAQGLGGAGIDQTGIWVGLNGAGGVPSDLVRSVYLTFDISLDRADTVSLSDGQQLKLPAGRSIVTTVVTPDELGGVTLRSSAATGSLRASVLGWVAEASADLSSANVTGSYVADALPESVVKIRGGKAPRALDLTTYSDADYALALVASVAGAPGETTLDWRSPVTGRAAGVALDGTAGAAPQLALVPVDSGSGQLSVRRGAATVQVQSLGAFLGEAQQYDAADPATIEITAPRDLASIDLSESGYFTLEGVVDGGANAVDRVEVSANDAGTQVFIGTAELTETPTQTVWSMRVLAPDDGEFDYTATVFDRSNRGVARASDEITLDINAADATDTVTSPEVRTFGLRPGEAVPRVVDADTVAFAEQPDLEPGQIIVTGPLPGAASGFLGRVSQMNLVAGEWLVTTVAVELSEVFFQVDVAETIDYQADEIVDQIAVEDTPASGADPSEFTEGSFVPVDRATGKEGTPVPLEEYSVAVPDALGNGPGAAPVAWPGELPGHAHAALVRDDDVDLTLGADDFNLAEAGLDPANPDDFALACRAAGSDGQEPTGDQIDENGEWHPAQTGAPAAPACAQQRLGVDLHGTWSIGMDASFIVGLRNGKPKVLNTTKLDPWEFDRAEKRELATEAAIGVQASGEAEFSLDFVLNVKMKWKWKVVPAGITVQEFTTKVTTTLKASAALKASFKASGKLNFKLDVAEVALPTTMFMVGPVPVAITNRLNFAIAMGGEVMAEVALPAVGVERVDTFGFTWKTGQGLSRIKNDTPTKYVVPKFTKLKDSATVSFTGGISVGPEVSFRSRIYSFAGPDLALSAKAGVGGEITGPIAGPYDAKVEVYLALGLEGMVKLTLIKWELVNLKVFALGVRLNLFTKEWSFSI
ncbi:hypothetical protein [Leucobacter salsicius]|uniref:hypothetical protein n=1 Tax=Leucobacter salsicius TaxID=664638 RepID=UPI000345CE54|nr:hypothetical protein [Leucobacter salsicius]